MELAAFTDFICFAVNFFLVAIVLFFKDRCLLWIGGFSACSFLFCVIYFIRIHDVIILLPDA